MARDYLARILGLNKNFPTLARCKLVPAYSSELHKDVLEMSKPPDTDRSVVFEGVPFGSYQLAVQVEKGGRWQDLEMRFLVSKRRQVLTIE